MERCQDAVIKTQASAPPPREVNPFSNAAQPVGHRGSGSQQGCRGDVQRPGRLGFYVGSHSREEPAARPHPLCPHTAQSKCSTPHAYQSACWVSFCNRTVVYATLGEERKSRAYPCFVPFIVWLRILVFSPSFYYFYLFIYSSCFLFFLDSPYIRFSFPGALSIPQ